MADEDQDGSDAAAEAFEEVRAELTLVRRGMERISARLDAGSEPKDYDETLGRVAQAINRLGERMDALVDRPGIKITPEGIARQIAAAGSTTRAEDQRMITEARGALERTTAQLAGVVASARRGDEQNRWLMWGVLGGVVAGMILWAALAGVVARAMPASWQWPEKMAARTLDMPMWDAGRQLAVTSSPETWNTMVAGAIIVQENGKTIEGCRKAASRADEAVRCTVRIGGSQDRTR